MFCLLRVAAGRAAGKALRYLIPMGMYFLYYVTGRKSSLRLPRYMIHSLVHLINCIVDTLVITSAAACSSRYEL